MEEAMKAITTTVNVEDIAQDFRPFLVIYKDGRVHRLLGSATVPTTVDAATGVASQDVVIENGGVWVRLYNPNHPGEQKLPVLVYFHGGGFAIETAAGALYHNYLNNLACKAKVIVVSVDYRKGPEYPVPAAYEDSWKAIEWLANGPEDGHPWIRTRADLDRVFFGGDSAGANIAHHMAKRLRKGNGMMLKGVVLVHPFFWGKERIGSEKEKVAVLEPGFVDGLWGLVCPGSSGLDDPFINPSMDPELADMGGEKIMVWVAEKDLFRDRGYNYKEVLIKSGCKVNVEVVETPGEDHVFHLFNPDSPNAARLMDQVAAFINSA